MRQTPTLGEEIRDFILANVSGHPDDIGPLVAIRFGVSRAAVSQHIRRLVALGRLEAIGAMPTRSYRPGPATE